MTRLVSERRASIDVGTNSVRLLVGDVHPDGRVCPLVRRGLVTRLGEGLDATGRIGDAPAQRTLDAIQSVLQEARSTGVARVLLAATNALRSATNGPEIARRIQEATGLEVRILSGEDEARLVFRSLQAGRAADGPTITLDIGGGSTEFAAGYGDALKFAVSLEVGCVRLFERAMGHGGVDSAEGYAFARQTLRESLRESAGAWGTEFQGARIHGVGGTLTAFAMVHLATRQYDPDRIEGTRMTHQEVARVSRRLREMAPDDRRRWVGEGRGDLVPAGAAILDEAVAYFEATEVEVSTRGLRFGLLHEFPDPPAAPPGV